MGEANKGYGVRRKVVIGVKVSGTSLPSARVLSLIVGSSIAIVIAFFQGCAPSSPSITASKVTSPSTHEAVAPASGIGEGALRDNAEVVKSYRQAAAQGDALAQYNLGVSYEQGRRVPRDYAEAVKWFRQAAAQGLAPAQYNLGWMYHQGEGVPRDYAEAVKWYRQAAAQGYASAQLNLGVAYHDGEGVPRDYVEAVKWFRRAVVQGDALAQYNLGRMYHSGEGMPRDYVAAYMWFSLAAAQGDEDAHKALDLTETLLTPEQRAEAQKMAREWKPQSDFGPH